MKLKLIIKNTPPWRHCMWRGRWGGGGRRNAASSPDLPSPSPAAWAEWCMGLEAWRQNQRLNAGGRGERGVSVCLRYNSCIFKYINIFVFSLCSSSFMSTTRMCFVIVFDVFICSCLLLVKAFSAYSICWTYFKKIDQSKGFVFFRQAEWPGPMLHPSPLVALDISPLAGTCVSFVFYVVRRVCASLLSMLFIFRFDFVPAFMRGIPPVPPVPPLFLQACLVLLLHLFKITYFADFQSGLA